jgi:AbrB family looped-hinge helix DNA binding protein
MTKVKIRRKGTITIPAKLRKEYKFEEGQTLTIIDLGKCTILLTPKVSQVDKLANQIAEKFKKEMMRIIVCDTGPLLHLSETGAIRLLSLAVEILIPSLIAIDLKQMHKAG